LASKSTPFFQIVNVIAAIFRARVRRAIVRRIPFCTRASSRGQQGDLAPLLERQINDRAFTHRGFRYGSLGEKQLQQVARAL